MILNKDITLLNDKNKKEMIILLNQMKINKKLPLKIKILIMNNTNNLTEMMTNLSFEQINLCSQSPFNNNNNNNINNNNNLSIFNMNNPMNMND